MLRNAQHPVPRTIRNLNSMKSDRKRWLLRFLAALVLILALISIVVMHYRHLETANALSHVGSEVPAISNKDSQLTVAKPTRGFAGLPLGAISESGPGGHDSYVLEEGSCPSAKILSPK